MFLNEIYLNMEEIYSACVTYEPNVIEYVDFSRFSEPVWILGRDYNVVNGNDFERLHEDIRSRLWFTYRKNFQPIGDTFYTSDSGWGCMHRCGQMLLGQAFLYSYLGRGWTWSPESKNSIYFRILNMFNDKEQCPYSLHKIAKQGNILDKKVGQWFGPNTIVQVLKKLTEEDTENNVVVHVAMDNMVIKSELKKLFRRKKRSEEGEELIFPRNELDDSNETGSQRNDSTRNTHPVLLTIPLRLGLSEITPVYFEKLKSSFEMRQSLGIIGGRTNHASYFIGYVGDELIYLDPHTTQPHCCDNSEADETYHSEYPSRMEFSQLDPSIALCFYCQDEEDFEEWCKNAQQLLLEPEKDALFEILDEKLPMLPYVDIVELDDATYNFSLQENDRIYTSDDEFELLM